MDILILAMSMGIGGAETHVLTLARAYRRAGHRVRVASAGGELTAELERDGIPHTLLPLDRKSPLALLRSAVGILRLCRRESYDAIHAHGRIPAFCAELCRRLCRFSPRPFPPVTVTVHGTYASDVLGAAHSAWGERTIAVSSDIADYTARVYGIPRKHIHVIPNGVELRQPSDKSRSHSVSSIVTVSRLDRDSAAAALELCRILPRLCREFPAQNITLTVVGGGELLGDVRAAAQKANSELGRRTAICVGATVDAQEISASADIFIGTSRAALEAMAAGVPVLLYGNAGMHGLLTPANLGAAIEDNLTCRKAETQRAETSSALYDELRRFMLMNAAERGALGRFCRDTAEKYFDIDRIAQKNAEALRSAAREARGGILLCGYYGAGNAGDDASLAAIAGGLSRLLPQAPLLALTRGGKSDGLPSGLETVHAFSPSKIKKALRRSRILLLGGGSLLQDSTSLRSLVYYSRVVRAARRAGCSIIIWGGVAPLRRNISRRIAQRAVRSANVIFARDDNAAKAFASLGGKEVRTSADPAWLIPYVPLPQGIFEKYRIEKDCFVIAPRPIAPLSGCGGKAAEDAMITALAELAVWLNSERGMHPILAALSPEDDAPCRRIADILEGKRVSAAYLPSGALTPGQLVTLLGGVRFTVAVRMHAALFALLGGSEAVCIDYDPKVTGLAYRLGVESVPIKKLNPDRLQAAAERLFTAVGDKKAAADAQKSSAAETLSDIAELYGL